MKRILFLGVMLGLGFLLNWGGVFLPSFLFPKPVLSMESSVPRVHLTSMEAGGLWDETWMLSQALPTRTAMIDRGQQLYESGDFEGAVGVWQAVAEGEKGMGRSIALSNLKKILVLLWSLASQSWGDFPSVFLAIMEYCSVIRH